MQNYTPQLETIASNNHGLDYRDVPPWFLAPRARVFILIFLLVAAIGLVYTFLQPSVYQSRASVLMAALTAVDKRSGDADIEHVAIQRRILLGSELIRSTQNLLMERGFAASDASELGEMLDVADGAERADVEVVGEEGALLGALFRGEGDVEIRGDRAVWQAFLAGILQTPISKLRV